MYNLLNALLKGLFLLLLFALPSGSKAQDQNKYNLTLENTDLDMALQISGNNRSEIEKLLMHYSDKDSPKYKAVCYLIKNMQYHTHINKEMLQDSILKNIILITDSLYYNLVKGKKIEEIKSKSITDSIKKLNFYISNLIKEANLDPFANETIGVDESPALENISSVFIIGHIDHAFEMREKIDLVKQLEFEEFCEYILSHQSVTGRNISKNGKDLNSFFSKYLPEVNKENIPKIVEFLNLTINNFRKILGKYPYSYKRGFEELLFTNVPGWDCFDVTSFETSILNALGIPTVSEHNAAYKMLQGKHSLCAVYEKVGNYTLFALEGTVTSPEIKQNSYESYTGWMNIYRQHYSKQNNTPTFLKALEEEIPQGLSSPLIEDITSLRMETTTIEIPFDIETQNNLAYLGTFNSESGIVPITWGTIDKKAKKVLFINVIPNRIYFPVYYEENAVKSFSYPFIVRIDSLKKNKFVVQKIASVKKEKKINVSLTRKFPQKPKMLDIAKNLIGTAVLGSNVPNFKERDTLYTLNFELQPYLQDIVLKNTKPYRYYRIEAPIQHRNMNLSEVQYLTSKEYGYKNTIEPTGLPLLSRNTRLKADTTLTRLLEDSIQKISKWPEYDGKMTTAPGAYPNITFRVKEPQVVTHLRIAPLNEDNGIAIGDTYALFYWREGEWQEIETKIAEYNHLYYNSLSVNGLYWLKNLSRGKEELPFFIDKNGAQSFIYSN